MHVTTAMKAACLPFTLGEKRNMAKFAYMCQQHRRGSTVSQWYRVAADPRCLNGTVRREAVPLGGKQAVGPLSKTGVSESKARS